MGPGGCGTTVLGNIPAPALGIKVAFNAGVEYLPVVGVGVTSTPGTSACACGNSCFAAFVIFVTESTAVGVASGFKVVDLPMVVVGVERGFAVDEVNLPMVEVRVGRCIVRVVRGFAVDEVNLPMVEVGVGRCIVRVVRGFAVDEVNLPMVEVRVGRCIVRVVRGFAVDEVNLPMVEVGFARICTSAWGNTFIKVVLVGVAFRVLHERALQVPVADGEVVAGLESLATSVEVKRVNGVDGVMVTLDTDGACAVVAVGRGSCVLFEIAATAVACKEMKYLLRACVCMLTGIAEPIRTNWFVGWTTRAERTG